MPVPPKTDVSVYIDRLFREQSRQVLATLIRLLGSFELAEDALQEAFSIALKQWPEQGVPENPRAWLISTGRFKAIDKLRRQERFRQLAEQQEEPELPTLEEGLADDYIEDDSLRLIFLCCHPALSAEARVALTLREVCGLTTEQVASAFLTKPATLAQRIVRAKRKIKGANIPYEIPLGEALPQRLQTVLQVVYLVFNEGYSTSVGEQLQRSELMEEAVRLGRLLHSLIDESEVTGLLSLMLFQASRQQARLSDDGDLLRLHEQDRRLWDQAMITEADDLVRKALRRGRIGPYALQAAIAGIHATSQSADTTDWREILALYNLLLRFQGTPIVRLNRAVALGHVAGPEAALAEVEQLMSENELAEYHLLHATHAHFHEQLGHMDAAIDAYQRALDCAQQRQERGFLIACIKRLKAAE